MSHVDPGLSPAVVVTREQWRPHADALAATVAVAHRPRDEAWLRAVREVPRHMFVPWFYRQPRGGEWERIGIDHPDWLRAVYEDAPLVTALLPDGAGHPHVVSSSSKPTLMIRMLDALDVGPGDRVLEVGTGTGYNAGLLSHRLGGDNVYSVDVGARLVDGARARLRELGHTPTLAVGDGRQGLPAHGPYDRIVVTCSVSAVPWSWAEQLRPGGIVLADLKVGLHAGNLALLRRDTDGLNGRFLSRWAGFMSARDADTAPEESADSLDRPLATGTTTTRLDPDPWTALVPWFLSQAGGSAVTGYVRFGPEFAGARFTTADGSWCEVGPPDEDADRTVRAGGPCEIWRAVETAYREWVDHGSPGWDRLGLTVTRSGEHRVWLDDPGCRLRRWSVSP